MERHAGYLLCDKCNKQIEFANGACVCMFCGGEYSREMIFLAVQETRQIAFVSLATMCSIALFTFFEMLGGVKTLTIWNPERMPFFLLLCLVSIVLLDCFAKKLYPVPKEVLSKSP